MDYKTILVHVDGAPQADARIAFALQLALRHDAHLAGVALTGVSRLFYRENNADLVRSALAAYIDEVRRRCESQLERFALLAAQAGLASYERRLVDDETSAGLALAARYADLVVLGQADPAAPTPPGGELVPHLLLACPRPLLVLPCVQAAAHPIRRVLLAWNGSVQALRALAAALPLLRQAEQVTLAAIGAPGEAAGDEELAPYLRRHGVAAALVREPGQLDPGKRLLSLLADQDADLLVMGGYGRARLSELLLGGVTRTVLKTMSVPVLLAH